MIKNDRWIREQCSRPTHLVTTLRDEGFRRIEDVRKVAADWQPEAGTQIVHTTPLNEKNQQAWVSMIEPFVPEQVRTVGHARLIQRAEMSSKERLATLSQDFDGDEIHDAKRIVSFGTSSFGYDVRLARKFKIFTNINSGVIDPLDMQDKCYVDFEGECCIIPPNSYVLGHTIETFTIPRDVMVLCVGKSTYARCGAIVNVTPIEAGFVGQVVIEISNATNLPLKVHANQGIAQFLFFQSDEACETSYADRGGKYQGQQGITTAKV